MKYSSSVKISTESLRSILILLVVSAFASDANAGGGGKLTFKDPVLSAGTAGANGAVYTFQKVDKDINALVKIKGRSDTRVYLKNIDLKTSGFDKAWQPEIGINNGTAPGAMDWWMEFEVSFVDEKKGTPITIDEFDMSAIDIDGNGDRIREYVSFYAPKSYTVEKNSILSILNLTQLLSGILKTVGVRFDGPTMNFVNIDTSGTGVMATAKYVNTQTYTVRMGAVASAANGGADRMYSMYFQDFKYTQPSTATLPVKLKSFDATVSSSKVNLEWSTAEEVNFSHFIIQRSTDGHDFTDAAMVLSNSHSLAYEYSYSESFKQNTKQVVYYRLKMVDIDGSFKLSNIRLVKLNETNNQLSVTTFPNPVASELRITVPSQWQNKQVSYNLVNLNGSTLKRKTVDHASQIETITMADVQAGVYVVKLTSGNDTAIQQIVKK